MPIQLSASKAASLYTQALHKWCMSAPPFILTIQISSLLSLQRQDWFAVKHEAAESSARSTSASLQYVYILRVAIVYIGCIQVLHILLHLIVR